MHTLNKFNYIQWLLFGCIKFSVIMHVTYYFTHKSLPALQLLKSEPNVALGHTSICVYLVALGMTRTLWTVTFISSLILKNKMPTCLSQIERKCKCE